MIHEVLYWAILGLMVLSFAFDKYLEYLNFKTLHNPIPEHLKDIYPEEEHKKQIAYHTEYYRYDIWHDLFYLIISLVVFAFQFLGQYDLWLRKHIENEFLLTLTFFAGSGLVFYLIQLPFDYYETFVIEQKYGFNTTTIKTYVTDQLKSLLLGIIIGLPLLWIVFQFFVFAGTYFWLYTWLVILAFSLFITFFYSKLIVPLFNKQTPLPDGELKDAIYDFCKKVNFPVKEIYILDASKRSKKANAYFTGFGKNKRIVLFDTLVEQITTDEIVAVLSHEIGHFKHKHIIKTFVLSSVQMLFTLYILSLFINNKHLAMALGSPYPSFHLGIISFSILFSPISTVISIAFNYLSRYFEKQADLFAVSYKQSTSLRSALKKLSRANYSLLTPHPLYVKIYYSHPPLIDRIKILSK